jgi:FixJ family two-component response regulator
MSPTVFVVDDDDDLRHSLTVLLRAMKFTARSFATPQKFSEFYRPEFPGCLVLDIQMPGQSGLELYEQLLREGKRLPVIFVTAHAEVSTAVAAMKSGAIDFLEKPFEREMLLERVERALALDHKWRASDERFADLHQRLSQLNDREQETLQMIVAGEGNKRIAAHFEITERAVEMRRAKIMEKLNVTSLGELLDVAVTYRVLAEVRSAARQQLLAGV